ncbi:MAG TPA: hypothetical protein VLV45_14940 [Gemmatimonadales bacterium]|nr:hypothetical protein [Gemmatimonadales bacterium]
MKIALALLAVVVLTVQPLPAQYPRLAARASPEVQAAVVPVLDSARAQGLPVEPLEEKVLEGVTKSASPDRIAAAVRRLAADLAAARTALGDRASTRELEAGAGALRAGITPRDLTRMRAARKDDDPAVALEVATDLVSQGVAAESAAAVVLNVVSAGASDGDLEQMRAAVARDIAGGVPPSVAAALRGRALSAPAPQRDASPEPAFSPRD